jgi:5-methylcytosine-specific restriction enzyme A
MSPHAALRPCLEPGCSALVTCGRCSEHQKQYQQRQDDPRTANRERNLYWSARWRAFRKQQLSKRPLCVMCEAETPPRYVLATELDHKTPVAQGGAVFDPRNVQGLCKHHHSQKTLQERSSNRGGRRSL